MISEEIVALVGGRPGITTREILGALGRRRADVLSALDALERERMLRSERAKAGARAWYADDRFPGQEAALSGPSSTEGEGKTGP